MNQARIAELLVQASSLPPDSPELRAIFTELDGQTFGHRSVNNDSRGQGISILLGGCFSALRHRPRLLLAAFPLFAVACDWPKGQVVASEVDLELAEQLLWQLWSKLPLWQRIKLFLGLI